jgi:uncharacterized protein YjbJ (UPF0337 family)
VAPEHRAIRGWPYGLASRSSRISCFSFSNDFEKRRAIRYDIEIYSVSTRLQKNRGCADFSDASAALIYASQLSQCAPNVRSYLAFGTTLRTPAEPDFIAKEINAMNWDRIEGNWKQAKGKIKEQWGKLTDDHLDKVAGKRDQLVGKIQECYGIAKDDAERQVKDWETRYYDETYGETRRRA